MSNFTVENLMSVCSQTGALLFCLLKRTEVTESQSRTSTGLRYRNVTNGQAAREEARPILGPEKPCHERFPVDLPSL